MLRIRVWRLLEGLTQEEAARKLGLSQLTYSYLESGRLRPTPDQLERLRRTFGDRTERVLQPVGNTMEVLA
jgi:transcriptional regulator with XRE-family HTH domain